MVVKSNLEHKFVLSTLKSENLLSRITVIMANYLNKTGHSLVYLQQLLFQPCFIETVNVVFNSCLRLIRNYLTFSTNEPG